MGEAKRRKTLDPDFGKPPIRMEDWTTEIGTLLVMMVELQDRVELKTILEKEVAKALSEWLKSGLHINVKNAKALKEIAVIFAITMILEATIDITQTILTEEEKDDLIEKANKINLTDRNANKKTWDLIDLSINSLTNYLISEKLVTHF